MSIFLIFIKYIMNNDDLDNLGLGLLPRQQVRTNAVEVDTGNLSGTKREAYRIEDIDVDDVPNSKKNRTAGKRRNSKSKRKRTRRHKRKTHRRRR